jgi:hypothetical protein
VFFACNEFLCTLGYDFPSVAHHHTESEREGWRKPKNRKTTESSWLWLARGKADADAMTKPTSTKPDSERRLSDI